MYFEFTLADLKEVKSNLEKIERNVLSRKSSMEYGISTIEDQGSNYAVTSTETYEKQIETCDSVLDMIEPFEMRVQEIIDAIEDTEAVENENVTFIYDAEVLDIWITNIKDVLSMYNPDYKAIFTLSGEYIDWENGVTSKLDNTDQIFEDSILEEAKQQDDEKVFRHNRTIMQGLELKLREAISNDFVEQLDNIDDIKEKLDGLFVLDEISDIRDIIVENVKVGSAPNAKALDNVMDMEEVVTTTVNNIIEDYLKDNLPKEVLDFLSNMQKYGGVTLQGSEHAIAEFVDGYKFLEMTESGINKWKINKKDFAGFEEWYETDPDSFNHLFDALLEDGMEGVYRFDSEKGKWFTIEDGSAKYYDELPKSISEGTKKGLAAFGYAIDGYTILDGIHNGDYSEIEKGAGSIIGTLIAATIVDPIPFDGLAMIGIDFLAGYVLGTGGSKVGEAFGQLFDDLNLKNSLEEAGIEVIWE
ncbi:hypothetical protein R2F61_03930 [Mollicutes bacterium LVI A0078]|nr:hypothetical protein RZE84_03955 [Mollicutes bacterium LVI A0075]WOO91712.1 hypothetical protein R2F61_03930 [Mollicutes bacterium LVI A0078]